MDLDDSLAEAAEDIKEDSVHRTRELRKRNALMRELKKPSYLRVNMKPPRRVLTSQKHPWLTDMVDLNKRHYAISSRIPTENPYRVTEVLRLRKTMKPISPQPLETIFEEPKTNSSTETLVGEIKIKRLVTCKVAYQHTKEKTEKREEKIKKLLGNHSFLNRDTYRDTIPMQEFLDELASSSIKHSLKNLSLEVEETDQTETIPPIKDTSNVNEN